jgi:hypothetical protein
MPTFTKRNDPSNCSGAGCRSTRMVSSILVTSFTRSSGGFRQRRGCFMRLSTPTGESVYGLLLALEGSTYREPPTLTEVPIAEITLIVGISRAGCRFLRRIRLTHE